MKKLLSVFANAILFSSLLFSQQHTSYWPFGHGAAIDFSTGSAVSTTSAFTNIEEGSTSMSDAEGNLLFYANGEEAYDATHQIMPNGDELEGFSSAAQGALTIPMPNNPDQYYLFTQSGEFEKDGTIGLK